MAKALMLTAVPRT